MITIPSLGYLGIYYTDTEYMGIAAMIAGMSGFVQSIESIVLLLLEMNTKLVDLGLVLVCFINSSLWTVYGLVDGD